MKKTTTSEMAPLQISMSNNHIASTITDNVGRL